MRYSSMFWIFIAQICSSFLAYQAARLACIMTIQRVAFAVPLLLATPTSLVLAMLGSHFGVLSWVSS